MGATLAAAQFIANAEGLSGRERVAEVVEGALIDSVAVALCASVSPVADRLVRGLAGESGSHRVLGRPETFIPSAAAMINGCLIHAEDWDDMGGCGGHPSASLFPALLALAEQRTVSGLQVIDAYAVGYQVGTVLHRYLTSDTQGLDRPWHPSGVVGPVAAAAAASRLLGLDVERTANAISVAASFAGGFRAQFGTDTKALHLGRAAVAGYMSATLAEAGITGDVEVFERDNGYGACFAPGASWRFMAHDLAGPLFLTSRHAGNTVGFGIAAKPWPWCGGAISAVSALEEILDQERIEPEAVDEITVQEVKDRSKGSLFRSPYSGVGEHGKFSLPYNLAVRVLYDEVSPAVHSDEAARRVLASGLLPRIRVVVQPFAEPRPPVSRVTVRLKDGRALYGESFSHRQETTPERLSDKFRLATRSVMDVGAADVVRQRLGRLRDFEDVRAVFSIIDDGMQKTVVSGSVSDDSSPGE
jgi:2-methylcitrate dehydratase PrpD